MSVFEHTAERKSMLEVRPACVRDTITDYSLSGCLLRTADEKRGLLSWLLHEW